MSLPPSDILEVAQYNAAVRKIYSIVTAAKKSGDLDRADVDLAAAVDGLPGQATLAVALLANLDLGTPNRTYAKLVLALNVALQHQVKCRSLTVSNKRLSLVLGRAGNPALLPPEVAVRVAPADHGRPPESLPKRRLCLDD